jgi:predicted transcriptional regulator
MTLTEAAVINAISNEQSLDLFKAIAQTSADSDILTKKTRLTRKQYYSRMSRMTKVGLIQRKNGKYFLTSLGKVIYQAQTLIGNTLKDYWKLKAIDSLEISTSIGLPQEEHDKILNTLIDDQQVKQILLVKNR